MYFNKLLSIFNSEYNLKIHLVNDNMFMVVLSEVGSCSWIYHLLLLTSTNFIFSVDYFKAVVPTGLHYVYISLFYGEFGFHSTLICINWNHNWFDNCYL